MYNSREKWRQLALLWTLAFESKGDYRIPCDSRPDALRLRAALYSCIRRARKEKFSDSALVEMAESLAIRIEDTSLLIYKRLLSPITEKIQERVDMEKVEGSLEKLKGHLSKMEPGALIVPEDVGEGEGEGLKNPYFNREEGD